MIKNKIEYNIEAHNKIAKKYDAKHLEIYNILEQDRLRKVIKSLIKKINKKEINVLDFGSGTGNLTKHFLDLGCNVTASDVSQESLNILKNKFNEESQRISTKLISGERLPFKDNSFDIVATYSVLHHIPNYLFTVKEMIRVSKKEGLIYIDHEVNKNYWNPNKSLKEYQNLTKRNKRDKLKSFMKNKHFLNYKDYKEKFIKMFINSRYQPEGDIHVFIDDHIEWNKICQLLKENNCKRIKESDYLLYNVNLKKEIYEIYNRKCNNMKYIIYKKISDTK